MREEIQSRQEILKSEVRLRREHRQNSENDEEYETPRRFSVVTRCGKYLSCIFIHIKLKFLGNVMIVLQKVVMNPYVSTKVPQLSNLIKERFKEDSV